MAKVEILTSQDGSVEFHYIYCPACGYGHGFDKRWNFNGDFDKPTFTPSMLVNAHVTTNMPVCHSFVTDGKIQYLSDCTHHMAGQTIDIPDLDDDLRDKL